MNASHRPISIAHGQGTGLHENMTRKLLAIVGTAVFLVIAPGFVAGLAPWWISHWGLEAPFFGMTLFHFAGGMLTTLGIIGILDSFVRFAVQGVGTPVPANDRLRTWPASWNLLQLRSFASHCPRRRRAD